jgi:magnesium-transporting ATPase (P-type)
LAATGVALSFEPPSASIHAFNATLAAGAAKGNGALGAEHLLLRGAVLRNTKWVLGAVVYTGPETKLVMNSRDAPSKMSTVETMVNQMIYFILGAMVVLTTLTLVGYAVWMASHDDELYYLCHAPLEGADPLFAAGCDRGSWDDYPLWSLWPTFFILYNNFLPISLYVTMELVNVAQAYFIDQVRYWGRGSAALLLALPPSPPARPCCLLPATLPPPNSNTIPTTLTALRLIPLFRSALLC